MVYSAALLVAALIACAGVAPARGVRILTDATFEHDTQAASGQTTGIWLLRFCTPGIPACVSMQSEWEALAEALTEEDPPILAADVDAGAAPATTQRLRVPVLPHFVMLRNRVMYTKRGTVGMEELRHWATRGWEREMEREVPAELVLGGGSNVVAAVKKAAGEVRDRFQAIVQATRSQDKGAALQAKAQLALPVLVSCLAALLVMLARAPARGGGARRPRPKTE